MNKQPDQIFSHQFGGNLNTLKKISKFLERKSKTSDDNYNSTDQAFFLRDPNQTNFNIGFNNQDLDKLPSGLNRNIKSIYSILGSPSKEIYVGNWTIMSLKKSLEIYNSYCNNGQFNVFDIGYRYLGMGHIELISCDLTTHLLFYRRDGGSNGYDRDNNFKKLIKDGSSNHKQFIFSEWFFNLDKLENS